MTPLFSGLAQRVFELNCPAVGLAFVIGFFVSSIRSATAVEFPGPEPGLVRARSTNKTLILENDAFSGTWQITSRGLERGQFRNRDQAALDFAGPVFKIKTGNGRVITSVDMEVSGPPRLSELQPRKSSRLADQIHGRQAELRFRDREGGVQAVWRALVRDGGNYAREELEISGETDLSIEEVAWLEQRVPNAVTAGRVDGSPITAGDFFFGCEDPMAINRAEPGTGSVRCAMPRGAILPAGQKLTLSFVIGVAPAGQMRRGFLYYVERERAHPHRPFLHYNSWYDISWPGFRMDEANCLEAIRVLGEHLIRKHGVTMEALVFDDGWDDPKTLWQFHRGFPNGFRPHTELAKEYGTRVGVWLSPFGGYGEAKAQRLRHGREQGYETNQTGFSLAGPKYYEAFKGACLRMIREYGATHFKFDGIASGMYANGSGPEYLLDTEAMRRLMLELRSASPDLFINLTTGSWPSPFWLRYADSVWRQGGDMGFAGKGDHQQQWLTYRDQEVFRNIVGKGPLYPLSALMTQGVAWSRHGSAAHPEFNSAGFKDDVRAFFGSGTCLQELYIQPQRLSAADWAVLAEAAKWARRRAGTLKDTHWIGGDPSKSEAYGYASWQPGIGIVMLRNPDDRPQRFRLELAKAFELPEGSPSKWELKSPWSDEADRPGLQAVVNRPIELILVPYKVLVLEATPTS